MKLTKILLLINIFSINYTYSKIFILIGPSGVGKSTLINSLLQTENGLVELISHTTRPMREGERDGRDYFFLSKIDYEIREKSGEFLISTLVHGNLYAISKKIIQNQLNTTHLICSLNTDAAKKVKDLYKENAVTIFIEPPSYNELVKRIYQRERVNSPSLQLRLKNAEIEIKEKDNFDYKIVNDNLSSALDKLKSIFKMETSNKLIIKQLVNPLSDSNNIRAMSYNIRMAPCLEDNETENDWKYRLPKIQMIFNQYIPDIIGIQEISLFQMESLNDFSYNLPYKFLGKYPTKKPYNSGLGICYNTQKLELTSEIHTLWLNESQKNANAPAWDGSDYERYIIYSKFRNKSTGASFWFLTTHFDHIGIQARHESAKITMNLAQKLDAPVIITGDFNCFPQLGGKELYHLLCTYSENIKDSEAISEVNFGVPGSWIGWDYDEYQQKEGYAKYDFVFVHDAIKVLQHGIIDDRVWDTRFNKELYPSDHRPVLSDLVINSY